MSHATNGDYAILLMNMGGPSSLNEIQPFLQQLFSDKDIIQFPIPFLQPLFAKMVSKLRAPKVAEHYKEIGGKSPILDLTRKQAKALEEELSKFIKCQVYIGMRYTAPMTSEALDEITKNGHDHIVLCPLYPHYSTTTTQSSFNEYDQQAKSLSTLWKETRIKEWFDFPDYIKALSHLISEKLKTYPDENNVHLCFSAHGLPQSIVDKGDPYPDQIRASVNDIMKDLGIDNRFYICFQSKVGPVKWLEPNTEDVIKEIAQKESQDILMIPISFVSDHFETDYEIDILFSKEAKELGIRNFKRIESLNDHPLFIKALSNLVLHHIKGGTP